MSSPVFFTNAAAIKQNITARADDAVLLDEAAVETSMYMFDRDVHPETPEWARREFFPLAKFVYYETLDGVNPTD